jgi:hypothetical protein
MTEIYGMVPRRAVCGDVVGAPALRLLVLMSSHADGQTRRCYASQVTLAEELGWFSADWPDTRRVRRYTPELLDADLIREDGRHVWGDGHWTDQYLVAPFPLADSDITSLSDDRYTTSPSEADAFAIFDNAIGTPRPAESDTTSGSIVTPRHDNQTHASDSSIKPIAQRPQKTAVIARVSDNRTVEEKRALKHDPAFLKIIAEEEARKATADAS